MNVTALAGGVGGAKLADGLAQVLKPGELTVIVNTGDDFTHMGLTICPDLDTVCYTLAGLANDETGWGRKEESWTAFSELECLGGPGWFRLGDRDLATHLERTRLLQSDIPLHKITEIFCKAWQINSKVIPMSNQAIPTWVETEEMGWLPFQEYFVRERCIPRVKSFEFRGVSTAAPAPGVLDAICEADVVVLCPSNPCVSIGPILAVPGVRETLCDKGNCVAVSPLIGGKTVKGPAAKMYVEMGIEPSNIAVAKHYAGLLEFLAIDRSDKYEADLLMEMGVIPLITNTLMQTRADRVHLSRELLSLVGTARGKDS